MINIEELRADIETGDLGEWKVYDAVTARRIARLPQLEREYLAMREALEVIQGEARRENGNLLHLRRCIHVAIQRIKGETQ